MSSSEASEKNKINFKSLSINQIRELIPSIRPDGKIRPIPKNASTEIDFEPILPGNTLVNFHDEYSAQRYYRPEHIDSWIKSNPTNPHTRKPLNAEEIQTYTASIDGDTAGKTLPHDFLKLYPDHMQEKIKIQFKLFGGQTLNSTIYKNSKVNKLIEKYIQLARDDSSLSAAMKKYPNVYDPIEAFVAFGGIFGDGIGSESDYLMFPAWYLAYFGNNISRNMSVFFKPRENESTHIFYVVRFFNRKGILNLPEPDELTNILQAPNRFNYRNIENDYIDIRNKLLKQTEQEFVAWLRENPTEFDLYKNVIYSSQRSRFVESLRKKTIQRLNTMVNELLKTAVKANNIRFIEGGRRKTRRSNKRSNKRKKNSRKNR